MAKIDDFEVKVRSKIQKTVRIVTRNVMNDLAEAGPVWTGEFRDSWVATSMGTGGTGTGGSYPYQLKDVPELPITKKETTNRKTKITISNLAEHAAIAMDLKESEYEYPGQEPEGDIVLRGTRQSGIRGDIGTKEKDGGDNRATAPLDWLPTYIKGGKFKRSIARGIKLNLPATEDK